ncbi:HEAT repeat domain-containing protein [Roseofilum capinflatum]|uniref:HEAT repeat domain-containing protein n=1 Tax=Roseofilum capinflatum BLCC-M114 TaxID=3022440 RepID=A0ABT7BCV0_9CYAN|nr:HEAT repeat domain-containing protein [Roseofilum capinflatum]MDJ1177014.1 HEAT repeat domain-containing protein [Roseofilum capinflatum BLCC-M114]
MTISIFTTDTQLKIRSWDTQLTEMTGLTPSEAMNRPLVEIIPELETRGLLQHFKRVLQEGVIETLAPALHHYLIPCDSPIPSQYFDRMQQRVTIVPLREGEKIVGTLVTVEDVTARLIEEKQMSAEVSDRVDPFSSLRSQDRSTSSWDVLAERRKAIEQCQRSPEITRKLVDVLRQEHRHPTLLNSVLSVLSKSQIDPSPVLWECLQDPDPELRIYAALALGNRHHPGSIEPLIKALDDPDTNVVYQAIESLGKLKASAAIDKLVEIAQSDDFFLAFGAFDALMQMDDPEVTPRLIPLLVRTLNWRVRREAVDKIALHGTSDLTSSLLNLLRQQHRNPNVLNSVLQVLVLGEVDPIPALVGCLQDPNDPDLRTYAAGALGDRADPRAIGPLMEALKDDHPNVKYHSIEALGRLKANEAVEALLEIATQEDFFLAFPALCSLTQIGERAIAYRLVPLLDDPLLAPQAAEALGVLGDVDVVVPLVRHLSEPGASISSLATAIASIAHRYDQTHQITTITDLIRQTLDEDGARALMEETLHTAQENLPALLLCLGAVHPDYRPLVAPAFTSLLSNEAVRETCIQILVGYGSLGTELLLESLPQLDLEGQKAAVVALGRIGDPLATTKLRQLLEETDVELVRSATAALAQIGDQRATESLLSLLGHEDGAVRLGAIAALNSCRPPYLAEQIQVRLRDSNPRVRECAVKIAGYFAFPDSIEVLIDLLKDPEEKVRRSAIEHLPYLDHPQVIDYLTDALRQETPVCRAAAARALGELEIPSQLNGARWEKTPLPALQQAMLDEEEWVRYSALRSIGQLMGGNHGGDWSELTNQLIRLGQSDPCISVRAAATECLGRVSPASIGPLTELAESGPADVARAALIALGRLDTGEAIAPLLNALNSPDPERRLDAMQAFQERGGQEAGVALQWMAAADPEERVTLAAIETLGRLGGQEAIASLLELTLDPANRHFCIEVLSRQKTLKEDYIDAIAAGLHHAHSQVRCSTVEVLKRLQHPYASEFLIVALGDSDESVRLAAVEALSYLGNQSCQPQLLVLARTDPSVAVRRAAQKAIHQ